MFLISADFFIIPEFLPPLSNSENSSLYLFCPALCFSLHCSAARSYWSYLSEKQRNDLRVVFHFSLFFCEMPRKLPALLKIVVSHTELNRAIRVLTTLLKYIPLHSLLYLYMLMLQIQNLFYFNKFVNAYLDKASRGQSLSSLYVQ